jgi:hypothetical protein
MAKTEATRLRASTGHIARACPDSDIGNNSRRARKDKDRSGGNDKHKSGEACVALIAVSS